MNRCYLLLHCSSHPKFYEDAPISLVLRTKSEAAALRTPELPQQGLHLPRDPLLVVRPLGYPPRGVFCCTWALHEESRHCSISESCPRTKLRRARSRLCKSRDCKYILILHNVLDLHFAHVCQYVGQNLKIIKTFQLV